MRDVMLDLETMGTGPDAAIIAIGAVEFDLESGILGNEFYRVVCLQSAVAAGGVMDASTVLWWLQQSDAARSAFKAQGVAIEQALTDFGDFLRDCDGRGVQVWGNGANFDNVVLASAFRRSMIATPWSFRDDRCYRTIKSMHPDVPFANYGTAHNALDDARAQAMHLFALRKAA